MQNCIEYKAFTHTIPIFEPVYVCYSRLESGVQDSLVSPGLHHFGKYGYFYAAVLSSENDTILPYGFDHIPFYEIP